MIEDRANNPARTPSLPKSLGGLSLMGLEIPNNVSEATLPAAGKSKWSEGVRTIDRSKDKLGLSHSAASHNKVSTDVTNMRKSGEAAKYSASVVEKRNEGAPKKTVKIKSN
jgi:hypothetical protein